MMFAARNTRGLDIGRAKMLRLLRFLALFVTLVAAVAVIRAALPWTSAEAAGARAGNNSSNKKAVVVIANAVNITDLQDAPMPEFRRLLSENAAIALMNARTAGYWSAENSYVTLGAGARALGSADAGLAFRATDLTNGEPAGDVYRRNTGVSVSDDEVVVLDIARIIQNNSQNDHPTVPGALGQALHDAGRKTAVVGNADSDVTRRLAATIAMDASGKVDYGVVGRNLLKKDLDAPWGVTTDYEKLWQAFLAAYAKADLVVVELGDTDRVNTYSDWLTDERWQQRRDAALREADRFLARVMDAVDEETTRVFFVSPQPSARALRDRSQLTFLAAAGPGIKPGLLSSPTTRRPGVVANIDLAASILDWLGIPTSAAAAVGGWPVQSITAVDQLETLAERQERAVAVGASRAYFLKPYVVAQIIVILLAIATIFLREWRRPWLIHALQLAFLTLTVYPLTLLLLPLVFSGNMWWNGFFAVAFSLAVGGVTWHARRSTLEPFAAVYLTTAGALAIDTVLGARLMQDSLLGYDILTGARYYGMGNEYMGVFIGSLIVGTAAVFELMVGGKKRLLIPSPNADQLAGRERRRLLAWLWVTEAALAGMILILGGPSLGANVGGTLAAVVGAVIIGRLLWQAVYQPEGAPSETEAERRAASGGNGWWKFPVIVGTLAVAAVVILAWWDYSRGSQTHLGRALGMVLQEGPGPIWQIIVRKVEMNWRLMHYTSWADVLVTFIIALLVLFHRPVGILRTALEEHPYLSKGFWGAIIAAITAFLVNDSGVVAAATLMLYPTAVLLALIGDELLALPNAGGE